MLVQCSSHPSDTGGAAQTSYTRYKAFVAGKHAVETYLVVNGGDVMVWCVPSSRWAVRLVRVQKGRLESQAGWNRYKLFFFVWLKVVRLYLSVLLQ